MPQVKMMPPSKGMMSLKHIVKTKINNAHEYSIFIKKTLSPEVVLKVTVLNAGSISSHSWS